MRHVLIGLVLLAVAASPRGGGCGTPTTYEPCADQACGVTCTVCDPADRGCVETDVVKACDLSGRCVPSDGLGCEVPPPPPPISPCDGQACGAACTIEPPCRSATPPCAAPSIAGRCDAAGSCLAAVPVCAPPPPPVDPCAGKACGATCNPCGDVNPCPTFAATACDRSGQCVTSTPGLCYDPCLGKPAGVACSPCPPGSDCTTLPCLWTCSAAGVCSCAGSPVW